MNVTGPAVRTESRRLSKCCGSGTTFQNFAGLYRRTLNGIRLQCRAIVTPERRRWAIDWPCREFRLGYAALSNSNTPWGT